jgi:hypothetical protein
MQLSSFRYRIGVTSQRNQYSNFILFRYKNSINNWSKVRSTERGMEYLGACTRTNLMYVYLFSLTDDIIIIIVWQMTFILLRSCTYICAYNCKRTSQFLRVCICVHVLARCVFVGLHVCGCTCLCSFV